MTVIMNQQMKFCAPILTPIEIALGIDENGMTTAKRLYDFLELNPGNYARWCKRNILDNPFAEEGKDYYSSCVKSEGKGNFADDYKLTAAFAKKLSMTQKNQKGEVARDYFEKVEDGAKQMMLRLQEMSPQLQVMINMELEQKRQAKEQERQAAEIAAVKEQGQKVVERVESIREVVAIDTTSWREDTRNLINKMAQEMGGGMAFQQIRTESYELLEKRMGANLKQRLINKRRRMAEEGTCKSARDKLSYVDIIAEDKKLVEGYTAIVKEMAIKYGVGK